MRIATHIKLFLTLILVLIAANATIGTNQINRITQHLHVVVNENFNLVKQINLIIQLQGQKALIVERAIRISEELNFESVPPARRAYMLNHAKLLKTGLHRLTEDIRGAITQTQSILHDQVQKRSLQEPLKYVEAQSFLNEVDKAHYAYNKLSAAILTNISNESYVLSLQDVEAIEKSEAVLSKTLKALHAHVDLLSQDAIVKTQQERELAVRVFKTSLLASFVFSLFMAIYIIGRISRPLADLTDAARKIGAGDFDVKLKTVRHDEVADVARAFNAMSEQLAEKNKKLQTQSQMLKENLRITEEQKKDLEKVNKEMDRFVYTVSHDIGAPLMGIAWYANYLKKHALTKLDAKSKDSIEGIVASTDRLNKLIKDLLTLTRLSRIKNPYEKVLIKDVIQEVLDRTEFPIKQAKAEIIVPDELPVIVCDRIKMGEIFYNLIANGIKFSQKEHKPVITIGYRLHEGMHEFSVADNGIGIDPKYHNDVFTIFKRLHTYAEYEGSGAGLSIVKTIINDHGGNIWVESHEDEGARFVFTIPENL